MTNSEKYLKEGVNIDELTFKFDDWHFKNSDVIGYGEALFRFLQAEVKPTLTEDERVILRNIPTKYWQKICRDNYGVLEIRGEDEEIDLHTDNISDFDEYNHLFQFIKERRRI